MIEKMSKKGFWDDKPITALVLLLGILGIVALLLDAFFGTTIAGISINSENLPVWAMFWVITLAIVYNMEM